MMKFAAIVLLSMLLSICSTGYAQTVTLSVKDFPIEKVFNEIKKQVNISFFWDDQTLKSTHPVTFNMINATIEQVLDVCVRNQPIVYTIIDKVILIKPKPVNQDLTVIDEIDSSILNNINITGKVVDENGGALAGATISTKNATKVTKANSEGEYNMAVKTGEILLFTYVGYNQKKIKVDQSTTVNVTLESIKANLDEVVAVGYGSQQKKNLVGSVGVISRKDFGDLTVSNTSQLIQGKISGVQVLNNNGEPGGGTQIILRGTGSFTNSSPLYVIDGIQTDAATFNALSPYDIDNITALKDASSVAIYGAQGANGVVIITTKKTRINKTKVNYDGYVGFSRPWKQFKMLNAEQYTGIIKEWYGNQGFPVPQRVLTPEALITRTDWQKEIFRSGKISEHHIDLGGSSKTVNYNVSLGFTNQQSQVFKLDYQRANFRVNLEEKIGERIKLGQQLNLRYEITNGVTAKLLAGIRMPPYLGIYDSTNLLGGFAISSSGLDGNSSENPLIEPTLRDIKNRDLNNYLQLFAEVILAKGLKFRSQFGGSYIFNQNYNFNPTYAANELVTPSQITEHYHYGLAFIFENYFTYNKQLGKNHIDVTFGNSYNDGGVYRAVNLIGTNFNNDQIHQIGAARTVTFGPGYANSQTRFISYFSRLTYTLKDRYIFTLTGRRDGVSTFVDSTQVGFFPSVGVGWKLSQETFMKIFPFINELKLWGSWGKTGNSNIQGFAYQTNVWRGNSNSVVYPLGPQEQLASGATVAIPSTNGVHWETTTTTDIGLDAGLFNSKILLTLVFYYRNNQDLLVKVPLPPSTGFGGVASIQPQELINAASAFNKGVEISLGFNGRSGEFNYKVNANAAYNVNQVTSLGNGRQVPILGGKFYDVSSMTRTDVGHSVGAFYGYICDHVAIDAEDVAKYNKIAIDKTGDPGAVFQSGLLPGDRIFKDLNHDGRITQADQAFLGSPIPKWNYGLSLNFNFRKYDFMVGLQGLADVQIINALKYNIDGVALPVNARTTVLSSWKKAGDITDITRIGQNPGTSANFRNSSWYVENGAYTRVRNVTIGYSISDSKLLRRTSNAIAMARVYFTAQNLFTITKYSGYDPEVSGIMGDIIFNRGVDLGSVPQPRSLLVGLQIVFN